MTEDLEAKVEQAIQQIRHAFGAPGDWGYHTPKGDALFALYKLLSKLRGVSNDPR